MEFQVACECRAIHAVAAGQAGSTIACSCGRMIALPSLAKLRLQAGLAAVPIGPESRIPQLVAQCVLPGRECVVCGGPDEDALEVLAVCERATLAPGRGRGAGSDLNWLNLLTVLLGFFHFTWTTRDPEVELRGRDTIVETPLAVCAGCRPGLSGSRFGSAGLSVVIGLALAGAVLLFDGSAFLAAGVIGGVAGLMSSQTIAAGRRAELVRAVRCVPEYAELLNRFPDAELRRYG